MLVDDLYKIKEKRVTDNGFDVDVSFDETHDIYKAHFPNNPITPGVCMIEVLKQLLEAHYNTTLFMTTVKNIKFLQVIVPNSEEKVRYKIVLNNDDAGIIKANVIIENDTMCFAKISVIYKVI